MTNGQKTWREIFASSSYGINPLDLGFAGDRTENTLLHLMERSAGGDGYLDDPTIDPDVIVLLIGVNNTWNTDQPVVDKIVAGNIAIISRLRHLRPHATIIVQSLLPAESSDHTRRYIVPVNQALRRYVQSFGPLVRWLDVYHLFATPTDSPSAELFGDGVHPNGKGYEIWAPELAKAIKGALASSPRNNVRGPREPLE